MLRDTNKQVGGLSTSISYTLENEAYKSLPPILKKNHGITVRGKLRRDYVRDNSGNDIEANIFGKGYHDGNEIVIIGESKSQLSKKAIDDFSRRKPKRFEGVFNEIFAIVVTHMTTGPEVAQHSKEKGIALYYSYDW